MSTSYTAKGDENGNILLPYKVYTALLSQSGTNDPVATVLEDTLDGTITWNRDSTGDYYAVYSDNFPSDKVLPFVGGIHGAGRSILFKQNSSNSIELATWDASNVLADSMISNLSIEIRVYN